MEDDAPSADLTFGAKLMEMPMCRSFDDLGLHPELAASVAKEGYTTPTPIQQHSMCNIKYGKDVIACAQTDSGKIAAFLLPIMNNLIQEGVRERVHNGVCMPRVLILAPGSQIATRVHCHAYRLAPDSGGSCNSALVYGLYDSTNEDYHRQKERILKGATILIGTVERIMRFIDDGIICLEQVKYFILYEADGLFGFGREFSVELGKMMSKGRLPPRKDRQTLMFSAFFPLGAHGLARTLLREDYLTIVVGTISKWPSSRRNWRRNVSDPRN